MGQLAAGLTVMDAIGIGGSILGGLGEKQESDYKADIARQRGLISLQQGMARGKEIRRDGKRIIGQQVAGFAKAGVEVNTGTPLEVIADTAGDIEYEALSAEYAGKIGQLSEEATASAYDNEGKNQFMGGLLSAGSTLIGKSSFGSKTIMSLF